MFSLERINFTTFPRVIITALPILRTSVRAMKAKQGWAKLNLNWSGEVMVQKTRICRNGKKNEKGTAKGNRRERLLRSSQRCELHSPLETRSPFLGQQIRRRGFCRDDDLDLDERQSFLKELKPPSDCFWAIDDSAKFTESTRVCYPHDRCLPILEIGDPHQGPERDDWTAASRAAGDGW